jgi:hypothetical protein
LATAGQRFIQTHYDLDVTIERWEAALLRL